MSERDAAHSHAFDEHKQSDEDLIEFHPETAVLLQVPLVAPKPPSAAIKTVSESE